LDLDVAKSAYIEDVVQLFLEDRGATQGASQCTLFHHEPQVRWWLAMDELLALQSGFNLLLDLVVVQ
jgi:hypothetical protein